MAEPTPARSSGKGGVFRRKLGPLPMWGWLAGGVGLLGIWALWAHHKAGQQTPGMGSGAAGATPPVITQVFPPSNQPPPPSSAPGGSGGDDDESGTGGTGTGGTGGTGSGGGHRKHKHHRKRPLPDPHGPPVHAPPGGIIPVRLPPRPEPPLPFPDPHGPPIRSWPGG